MDGPGRHRRISCKRCQTRKIKCDRSQPCSHCSSSSTKCEYSARDSRRRPVSHAYVTALESRVAWYESLVKKLKSADAEERDAVLCSIPLDDHLGGPGTDTKNADLAGTDSEPASPLPTGSLKRGTSGALQFHGPTSIYLDEGMDDNAASTTEQTQISSATAVDDDEQHQPPPPDVHAWSDLRLATAMGITEALIHEALGHFFTHQYPAFMFVYREAFLADYFALEHGGKYWSFSLLYAIGALGIAHSPNAAHRAKAAVFARCAEEIVVTHELERPAFTTVQALLCLAFHELGQGSSSKGWLLSGMAFRMGQDLGFQRDPRHWLSKDRSILTRADSEIRRRIYWGCYLADKFMSLFMGRPVCLVERDAEVEPVEPLPDFPDNHTWFGLTKIAAEVSQPQYGSMRPQLTKGLRHMVLLGEIFQNIIGVLFAPKRQSGPSGRVHVLNHLDQFNLYLGKWHTNLPECLQWSQWTQREAVGTNILTIHLFYHSIVLSLNRHFIGSAPAHVEDRQRRGQSQDACANSCSAVMALTRQFRKQPDAQGPPILLIYALVTVALTIATVSGRDGGRSDARIPFIVRTLADYSRQYKLAGEMRLRLVRYFRLPPSAATTYSSTPRQQELEPAARQQGPCSATEPMDVSSPSMNDAMPAEADALGMSTVFDDNNLEDLWSGGFQDWFLLDNNYHAL